MHPTRADVSHFGPRFPNSAKNMLALKVNGPIERGYFDGPEIAARDTAVPRCRIISLQLGREGAEGGGGLVYFEVRGSILGTAAASDGSRISSGVYNART